MWNYITDKYRYRSTQRDEAILDMIASRGMSYKYVGMVLGISKQRVHQLYRNYRPVHLKVTQDLKNSVHNCQDCGSSNRLCIHHIDKNTSNNNIDNLIVLCAKCHYSVHSGSNRYGGITPKTFIQNILDNIKYTGVQSMRMGKTNLRQMKILLLRGESISAMARLLNVSRPSIRNALPKFPWYIRLIWRVRKFINGL